MAAGAILPPLFFERRRPREPICSGLGILWKNTPETISASITGLNGQGEGRPARSGRSLPKDT